MKTKIYLVLTICLMLMLQIGCTEKNANTDNSAKTNSPNVKLELKDDEILYGKYPEPILIAIGENNAVKKDYKHIIRGDLKKITNLSFRKEFDEDYVNKKYGFEENKEYDFSVILEMPNLNSLEIDFGSSNIRLKDYSILCKLSGIDTLFVSNISDSDISNIIKLNSLTHLSISHSSITNIEFVKDLPKLEFFYLDYISNIKSFEALKYLKNIKQINLCNLNMTEKELDTIPEMPTLTSLSLIGNNLTNIYNLTMLKSLRCLSLGNNPLTNINISSNRLPKMYTLDISNTLISDVSKIKGIYTIEEIYIKNTKITKIAPFKKYKNLKFINATLAKIKDKKSLDGTKIWVNEE